MASGVPASDKRGSSFFVLQSHGEGGFSSRDGRRTARGARRRRRRGIARCDFSPSRRVARAGRGCGALIAVEDALPCGLQSVVADHAAFIGFEVPRADFARK